MTFKTFPAVRLHFICSGNISGWHLFGQLPPEENENSLLEKKENRHVMKTTSRGCTHGPNWKKIPPDLRGNVDFFLLLKCQRKWAMLQHTLTSWVSLSTRMTSPSSNWSRPSSDTAWLSIATPWCKTQVTLMDTEHHNFHSCQWTLKGQFT